MYKLFISTYSELITIGLFKDNTLIMQKEKESEKSHSIYLVPMIDEILKENNIECQDLSEILVVNGPGSFTGIRLGVTVAKTLAYTLNIPIKTISSIEAISASIKDDNKIITISDTKGKYLGIFENNKLVNELMYLKNADYEQYITNYLNEQTKVIVSDYDEIIKLGKIVNEDFEKLFKINNLNRTEKIYVYLYDNKVTGFIHISSNYEIIDILNIVVNPKYEKQGIGTKLINYIIKKKDTIASKIMLEVREDNLKAINFYQKNNFTIIAKRQNYYKNKDALIMERNI